MALFNPAPKKHANIILGLLIIIVCFAIDILSKIYIANNHIDKIILPGILKITIAQNTGLAFSMLNNIPFIALAVNIVMFIILVILWKKMNLTYLPICIGGALGNLMERMVFGHVTDFISIMRFPIFNLGDTLIFIGIVLTLFFSRNEYSQAYGDYLHMVRNRKLASMPKKK